MRNAQNAPAWIGQMFTEGMGGAHDYLNAYEWYLKACQKSNNITKKF